MDPNRKIIKKFTKKFGSKVIDRQYFHRKTKYVLTYLLLSFGTFDFFLFSWYGKNLSI